jgi:SAM-dependent methyltransferase
MRREVYGEDMGQQGWRTLAEQDGIADILGRGKALRVLDVACGSGGPALALTQRTGCRLTGLDIEPDGIAFATAEARTRGLADRASFSVFDCSAALPFQKGAFDAVLCIDAISHLKDRAGTLAEWARVLDTKGRLVFTDVFVLTGPISKSEFELRASVGFHLLVPPGVNERSIEGAGLTLVRQEDRTESVAEIAGRWHAARSRRASALIAEEGADWFDQRQRFLSITAELAKSRRLSRFLYVAEKRASGGRRLT